MNKRRLLLSLGAAVVTAIIVYYTNLPVEYYLACVVIFVVGYFWNVLFPQTSEDKSVQRKDPYDLMVEVSQQKLGMQLGLDPKKIDMKQIQFISNRYGEIFYKLEPSEWIGCDARLIEYPKGTNRIFTHLLGKVSESDLKDYSIVSRSIKTETALNLVAEQMKIPKSKILALSGDSRGDEKD